MKYCVRNLTFFILTLAAKFYMNLLKHEKIYFKNYNLLLVVMILVIQGVD